MTTRATNDEWESARQCWESDTTQSFSDIAASLGVSKQAVAQRAKKQNWQRIGTLQNLSQRAQFLADKRGIDEDKKTFLDVQRSADVIDAATQIRADLLERHRADWAEHRRRFPLVSLAGGEDVIDPKTGEVTKSKGDFGQAKCAKITSEMLKIRQDGERKAYGLEDAPAATGGSAPLAIRIVRATKPPELPEDA